MRLLLLAVWLLAPAAAQETPRMVVVDLQLLVEPDVAQASLVWLGVSPAGTDGSWLLPAAAPEVLEASEPLEVSSGWSLVLPMRSTLTYFAVVDLNGNGAPDPGEPIGGPVSLEGAARVEVRVDRRLGLDDPAPDAARVTVPIATAGGRRTSDGSGVVPPPRGEGEATAVVVECATRLSFFDQGRLVVLGFAPGAPWPPGLLPQHPAFVRTAPREALVWPLSTTLELPSGLDLVVGLDLDGDGDLGPGDLVAAPRPGFVREAGLRFVLDRTLPPVRPTPPPQHLEFQDRPIQPGEPDGSEEEQ